jgi:hypothetical protein
MFIKRPLFKKVFFIFTLMSSITVFAQNDTLGFLENSPMYNHKRINIIKYSAAGLYPISMYWLYTKWYQDYPQSSFHFYDDSGEWLQMDKVGHMLGAYTIGKAGMRAFQWAGEDRKKAVWYGAGIGFAFQTTLEIFDGFSSEWGFSWTDIAANTLGSAALISQQLVWDEQRIVFKYSFHQSDYEQYRPDELGKNLPENILKDYNGLTYWASINPHSFMEKDSKFPRWLSLGVGYSAEGMTGAYSNPSEVDGEPVPQSDRYRQYYLSIDFDLSRIETKSKILSGFFKLINFIHLPAPAIEFNNGHKTKFYAFYF